MNIQFVKAMSEYRSHIIRVRERLETLSVAFAQTGNQIMSDKLQWMADHLGGEFAILDQMFSDSLQEYADRAEGNLAEMASVMLKMLTTTKE